MRVDGTMGKMVSVMLSDHEASVLESFCATHGLSKSDALRLALRTLLEERRGRIEEVGFERVIIKGDVIKEVSISPTKVYIVGKKLKIES